MIKKFFLSLRHLFFKGLLALIPLLITLYLLRFIVNFLSEWLYPLHALCHNMFTIIPYAEIIIGIVLVMIIGFFIIQLSLDKVISSAEEYILHNIPFVGGIYFGIKKIAKIIYKKDDGEECEEEQQVAWVRLPYKEAFCLGFMTGVLPQDLAPTRERKYFCFFIPSTPNPITGYYVIAGEGEFFFTKLTRQDALSMIISGGILKPE